MNRVAEEKLCVAKHEMPHWNVCLPHYYDNMCKHYNAWRHNKKNKHAVPATTCKGNLRQAAMLTIDAWKHLAAETEAQPFRNGNASHTRQSSAGSRTCAAEIGIGALLLDDPGGASAGGGSGGGGSRRPMGMRAAPPKAASCVGNASNFAGSSGRRPPMTSKTSACVGARNGSGKVAERNSSTRPRIVAGP